MQACKLPRFMEGIIGPRIEICVNSGPHIAMVPCLHQSNVYIKTKLRGWRAQKCNPLVGGKPPLTSAGLQTTPVHRAQYRADNGNLCKFGSTYRHGTVFAPKQCLYQKESKGTESSKIYFCSQCENHTNLCGPTNYPSSQSTV